MKAPLSPVWQLAIAFIFSTRVTMMQTMKVKKLDDLFKDKEQSQDNTNLVNYRLPNETYPEHYDITISTDVHLGERAFQGTVAIDIVVVNSTNRIVLHARQIKITKVNIESRPTGQTEELNYGYELKREFLTLKRKNHKLFKAGTKWKLTISYNGQLRSNFSGFYMSEYVDEDGKARYIASTQFSQTDARHAFPCYDEPAKRANFTITIHHSPNLTAISNMPVNEKLSRAGKTVFLTTARIPTYIVAFVVCDFEYTELVSHNVRHRVYSRSSRKGDHLFSLNSSVLYMNYFAEYFGIDYMLPKLDHVAESRFKYGGMENWGLIIYPEEFVLYNNNTSLTSTHVQSAIFIAHEVAHQWLGDLVSIQWWSNLWIKEGLAVLFSYKAVDKVFPEFDIWQHFYTELYKTALKEDAVLNTAPLSLYIEKPSDIDSIVKKPYYAKSASVLIMWQHALGEEVFQRALQSFLKNNQYSAASEEDLFVEIEKSAKMANMTLPASISEMMSTWIDQGGYPILTVNRNYKDGSFTVNQETFYKNESVKDSKTWYTPINFAVASDADFRDAKATHYLPNVKEVKIDAKLKSDDWLLLNKRSEYFYRINYDEKNYNLITQALIKNPFQIHPRNRAQLLNDAAYLSFAKRMKYEVLLEMMTYLKKEDQYAPWKTFSLWLKSITELKDVSNFKHFIRDLVTPIFKTLGVDEKSDEAYVDKLVRPTVIDIACSAGLSECALETNNKLKVYMRENRTMESELELVILKGGIINAGDNEFDFYYERLMRTTDGLEFILLSFLLGHAKNEKHIKKLVYSSIDMSNKLVPTLRPYLLYWVYKSSERNLLTCIKFLKENWDAYGNLQIGDKEPNALDSEIRRMASYVFNKSVEREFIDLVKTVEKSKHVADRLESVVNEKIGQNYEWLQKEGQPILHWLSQYVYR